MDAERHHYESRRSGLEFMAEHTEGPLKQLLEQQMEMLDRQEVQRLRQLALQQLFAYLTAPRGPDDRPTVTLKHVFVAGALAGLALESAAAAGRPSRPESVPA